MTRINQVQSPLRCVMTKVSRLGICVIGTGRAGMIHARNLAFGRVDHAALVAVVDPVEEPPGSR